jgi:hypothetical protein
MPRCSRQLCVCDPNLLLLPTLLRLLIAIRAFYGPACGFLTSLSSLESRLAPRVVSLD